MQYGSNELYHYGILGQKWGFRRYQNKDGSLTSEGHKRYSKKENIKKEILVSKTAEQTNTRYKNVHDMSDDELRAFVNRNTLEKQYLAAITPAKVEQGKSQTQVVLEKFGTSFVNTVATKSGEAMAKKIVSSIFGDDGSQQKKKTNK